MKILKATCISQAIKIETKDGGKLYKAAYESDDDVFIAYGKDKPEIETEYGFVKVYEEGKGTKYKAVEI